MPTSPCSRLKVVALLSALGTAALSPRMASATLGEPEASVQTDAAQFKSSIKSSTDRTVYRVHEIQLPSGTSMREYVGPDGLVFAVAWNGPYAPDLRQAFGKYFATFAAAPRPALIDHTHFQVEQAGLMVQIGGHMRAHVGRAYLPAAIPAGVDVSELQ